MKKFKEFIKESTNINNYKEPIRSIIKKELEYVEDVFTIFTDRDFKYRIKNIERRNKSFVFYTFIFYMDINDGYLHDFSAYVRGEGTEFDAWKETNDKFNNVLKRAHDILSVNFKFNSIDYNGSDVYINLVSDITDKKFEK